MQQRALTMAHWGAYEVEYDGACKAVHLHPFSKHPDPSPIGLQLLSDEVARLRVRRPAVRKSWLQHGPGAFPERRGAEPFVEIPWDEAVDLVADELRRVKREFGNPAIFAGSYGWASAGRFHHAQSQVRRFFNTIGGFVRHENDYSVGAALVLMPHIVAPLFELLVSHTSWDVLVRECRLFVAFGGVPRKNAQIASGGAIVHNVKDDLFRMPVPYARRRGAPDETRTQAASAHKSRSTSALRVASKPGSHSEPNSLIRGISFLTGLTGSSTNSRLGSVSSLTFSSTDRNS
jgi:biotin/methionine sulfoxide reductase